MCVATRPSLVIVPDALFDDPRMVELYDPLDPDRSDLDVYVALALEAGARTVLDIGCGTGTFALMLAVHGIEVVGVDPSRASVEVARCKPGAERVRWLIGEAPDALPLQVDLVDVTEGPDGLLVTFESVIVRLAEDLELLSRSTLRFPTRQQVEGSLAASGLVLEEVRDAPDRPGAEMVFVARSPG